MSLIIHHNDDDGRCAAAIIYNEFCMEETMTEKNFIEYNYNGKPDIDLDMLHPYDTVYILDISMNCKRRYNSYCSYRSSSDNTAIYGKHDTGTGTVHEEICSFFC